MQQDEIIAQVQKNFAIGSLNPMQVACWESMQYTEDILLLSPTGSGKTLAFLLPLWQLLKSNQPAGVQCLVLTPSRELAIQIEQVWKKMATGYKVSCCYGGHDMQLEIQGLTEPPALLVGTPGRIADHIKRATFVLSGIENLVFDEFDKSLALGFQEDMSYIVKSLNKPFRKLFVSATESMEIPDFAASDSLTVLDFITAKEAITALQLVRVVSEEKDKVTKLADLLSFINKEQVLVFCNHRDAVERTAQLLLEKGIENASFHGGMEQMQREQTLIRFRNGTVRFLIATDLAARGLDIPEIRHVVHFHLPATEAEFIHRNGRTARMEATGMAYLLMHTADLLPYYIKKMPELLSLPQKLSLPAATDWATIYINGGKKDKLNKIDIVGFFTQKGQLLKEDIGLIIVKDRNAFVAVKKKKLKSLLTLVQQEKIKGTRYRIAEAR
jgi:superfamily II DNA/RNA helicase